jgi:hypothetical protein
VVETKELHIVSDLSRRVLAAVGPDTDVFRHRRFLHGFPGLELDDDSGRESLPVPSGQKGVTASTAERHSEFHEDVRVAQALVAQNRSQSGKRSFPRIELSLGGMAIFEFLETLFQSGNEPTARDVVEERLQ